MKIWVLSIITIIACTTIANHLVFADDTGVQIQGVTVQPSTIRVGDNFNITATLVNNSIDTISVHNDCLSPFSAAFDSHATMDVTKPCIYFAISKSIKPGESITVSGPGGNTAYRAIDAGVANATITFSYTDENQTNSTVSFANSPSSLSKSVLFTILPTSVQAASSIPDPLKQFRSGVLPDDIQCNTNLVLIFKMENNFPACVRPQTAQNLVEYGWAKNQTNNGTLITLGEGQREGPLLLQKILPDNIQGLDFRQYPLATNVGYPITLHIGDSASNGCTEELTLVKIGNGSATFLKSENLNRNCPICLSENTVIDTPNGSTSVKKLTVGMTVFTQDSSGHKQTVTILKTGRTLSPPGHMMVHVVLQDKRELYVSPNHPTSDGRAFYQLRMGDILDGSKIQNIEQVPYHGTFTYDILPNGPTGFYWANGILVGSTLK